MASSSPESEETTLSFPSHLAGYLLDPQDYLLFIHSRGFERAWEGLGLSDPALRVLQLAIIANPKIGAVVPGTGGLRKLRFSPKGYKRGKSGSHRACYVYYEEYGTALLVTVYAKNQKDTLTQAEKSAIRRMIERQHELLSEGAIR